MLITTVRCLATLDLKHASTGFALPLASLQMMVLKEEQEDHHESIHR